MNNFDLLDAIGSADDRFKQEVIDHMSKNNNQGKYQRPSPVRRILRTFPIAAAIVLMLSVTAYAAVTHWGIFDFQNQKGSQRPFPTEAQEILQQQDETGSIVQEDEAGSTELVKCEITESINDGRQLNLTVRMQSAQPGQYALMSQMEDPSLPASYYGADYEGTLEEYMKEHNMIPLVVSASVKRLGNSGTGVESVQEKHQSPEIIDFLITCDMGDVGSTSEGVLNTTVCEFGKYQVEDVIRNEIPFSFELTDDSQSKAYTPVNQPDVEGVEITDVTVKQTELRTYIEITVKMSEKQWKDDGVTFRFSPDGEYKSATDGGYTEELEPGVYKVITEMVKTDLGDSFTMELISLWGPEGKTVLDEIEFTK